MAVALLAEGLSMPFDEEVLRLKDEIMPGVPASEACELVALTLPMFGDELGPG
jgi:hypothetical protein